MKPPVSGARRAARPGIATGGRPGTCPLLQFGRLCAESLQSWVMWTAAYMTPPDGPIFAVSVADLNEKEAVLASGQKGFFTIPHFDGFAAVLIQLQAEYALVFVLEEHNPH